MKGSLLFTFTQIFRRSLISCAAPNLRKNTNNIFNTETGSANTISDEDLYNLHLKRAKHILTVAIDNDIDIIVLGAFGCGAFCNNPVCVAKACAKALEECRGYFDLIEFAIFCRKFETENYETFVKEFDAVFP